MHSQKLQLQQETTQKRSVQALARKLLGQVPVVPPATTTVSSGGDGMAVFEERVAYLEGRVQEHSQMVNGIREAMASLEARMDRRFEAIDGRFEAIDRRFEQIDRRFEGVDQRLDALDAKMSRQFIWMVGIQVSTLLALAGGFAAVASGFASLAGR